MLAPKTDGLISEADYLAGEKLADVRHEYVNGRVYAMAGTSRRHNRIAMNMIRHLPLQDQAGKPCAVHASDIKVRADKAKAFYYPDIVVSCAEDETNEYYLHKPCLIAEITSPSTEWKDYAEKLIAYQKLPSLQVYLIVAQDYPQVTRYSRDAEGAWEVVRFNELPQTLHLPCTATTLTLADIYQGIDFTPLAPLEP